MFQLGQHILFWIYLQLKARVAVLWLGVLSLALASLLFFCAVLLSLPLLSFLVSTLTTHQPLRSSFFFFDFLAPPLHEMVMTVVLVVVVVVAFDSVVVFDSLPAV